MAKYYYNGVLLPEIPTELPYAYLTSSGTVIAGQYPWYYSAGKLHMSASGVNVAYSLSDTGWSEANRYTDTGGWSMSNLGTLQWSSHDIPNGSATATEIYFEGSNPVPEEPEEPETVTQYLIRSDTLTAIADGFRSSRGTTQKYTLDEMAVLAAEKTSGGGPMFASNASGRIPEYEKGTALSEFTLDFESSAVGALQEG